MVADRSQTIELQESGSLHNESSIRSANLAHPAIPREVSQVHDATSSAPNGPRSAAQEHTPMRKRDFGFLPIPQSRRHDPSKAVQGEFPFTWKINALFASAATIAVMNLYYIQPMLVAIANDLGVSHDAVSKVPILAQGGYGCGILFISPLGDLVRRRQLVLILMLLTTCLTIGLALSKNVAMLSGLSFVVGFFTITPQVVIPWTADLAPAEKRATAMSVTLSGLITGLVMGRTLAGVICLADWRYVYWMAVGLQGLMTIVLWLGLPDTPDKKIGLTYLEVLWSMAKMYVTYPTLVQVCVQAYCLSAVFAGFWTTLTFLLSDPPYQYNSLQIGLLGLLGLIGAILAPFWGRLVDRVHPWSTQFLGIIINLISMIIALAAAQKSIGAVCVAIVLYDVGQQLNQVSNGYRVAGIDPAARARLNGCNLLALFAGQTSGTAIMTKIYNSHGWHPTAGTAIAFIGVGIIGMLARGPHEAGWVGWSGGWNVREKQQMSDKSANAVTEKLRVKKKDQMV
ncbi:hypothetical protein L202_01360 [Cryptococcus amylolentus CBS 6039]|uniref:Major facilitator superfamily (MFS) profile domain-containing protein n=1 Tax=Cryptococcus amylolentus CBS 6039 TaxID=1295533 RepID=A0A1E3I3D5_9TREE|nr:hypothetical protein L202_01360 [Cryptococcus amylolentus CBS 6039]ODN83163.1 hypothetical protein L202_01360 [Cryptococcus amylolentus CBS 6039]